MAEIAEPANLYWAPVDVSAPNNSHAFSFELIGGNKRVLELGPAAGHFTRVLVENGCRVVAVEVDPAAAARVEPLAERVVVGDLSDPATVAAAADDEGFDVVLGGDVLEHVPDPLAVLRACRPALKPGGYVVLSLPNVAHADVKLQLLAGRFPYRDTGLLDRTHLHLFTLESIREMIRDAGLVMVDLRRVTIPVFHTEQAVDPATVSSERLAEVMADEESETYQFVLRAVVHDGNAEMAQLAERALSLQDELDRERTEREQVARELAETRGELAGARAELAALGPALDEARADVRRFELLAQEHQLHVEALKSTRSYRMLAPLRAVFRRRR